MALAFGGADSVASGGFRGYMAVSAASSRSVRSVPFAGQAPPFLAGPVTGGVA